MHECPRCNYVTEYSSHMLNHLNKKKKCEPFYNDTEIEVCIELLKNKKLKIDKNLKTPICYKCNHCSKIFDRKTRLKNHRGKCSNKQTPNFVYILQEREFIKSGEPIYKIGKTTRPTERIKGYPKGSILFLNVPCENCDTKEKELIEIFDKKFKQCVDIGREYYEGDLKEMIKEIIKAV